MLKGTYTATLDKIGRVKIPKKFMDTFKQEYGKDVLITTFYRDSITIYPIAEWERISSTTAEKTKKKPDTRKFLLMINRLGARTEIDRYGRVRIPGMLRDYTAINRKITIEGRENHLILKKPSRFTKEENNEKQKEKSSGSSAAVFYCPRPWPDL